MKKEKYSFKKYFVYDFLKFIGVVSFYIWLRPKRYYINKEARQNIKKFTFKNGCVVTSNHNCFKEPVYNQVTFFFRRHFVLAANDVPLRDGVKKFCKSLLAIFVSRDSLKFSEYKEIVKNLKYGRMIHVYAEGHVSDKDRLDEFKEGAVLFAASANVPIIPIYYKYRENEFKRVKYCVGNPIYMDDVNIKDKESLATKTRYLYEKTLELKKFMEDK